MPEPEQTIVIPDALPILPLRDAVLYPDLAAPVLVGLPSSIELVSETLRANRLAAVVAQKSVDGLAIRPEDMYRIGTMAVLHELDRGGDAVRLALQGVARIRVLDFVQIQPYFVARVEAATEIDESGVEVEALVGTANALFAAFVRVAPELSDDLADAVAKITESRRLAYVLASAVPMPLRTRQEILELDSSSAKLRRLIEILQHELAVRRLMHRITAATAEEISKDQKEHILRKQMESIERELGNDGPEHSDLRDLREQANRLPLPPMARKEVTHELERLERTPVFSPEHGMIRSYLDWFLKMPWAASGRGLIDVVHAREILDHDHYDLEKIKDRIVEYLAVKRLRQERHVEPNGGPATTPSDGRTPPREARGEPILCFLGPPGVGKTSLGQSIARALGRPFVRQSLGGVHDEAEIRGHRRTYIGAMPGRIMQALARTGAPDPVFMLDEIDKLGVSFHGDPSAALLELLDPAENHTFTDTYLGVPFDLSRVLFICTANTIDSIPAPLLDRMEVLALAGYTEREKLQIALRYLLPQQRVANGLREFEVMVGEDVVLEVVRGYTREAGVRNLERELGTILRKAARRISERAPTPIVVGRDELHEYLGAARFYHEVRERTDRPGVAAGLSVTPGGGEVLFVEASMIPGSEDRLLLTGMLGDVMRESAEAALTYLKANARTLGIAPRELLERRVVHVHVPAGAVPKDGPSAGVAMLVALASHALSRPVRSELAMTGEITLRGKVLPVGGIKEKVLAAHRAGLKTVVLPRRNEADLEDVPDEVRRDCRFVLVESVDDVLAEVLEASPREPSRSMAFSAPPIRG
jgi:ATP-dependent Lon protease